MNALHNIIALQYKQSIVISEPTGKTPAIHVRGLLLDISQLGYTLRGDAVRNIRNMNEVDFKAFHKMLISTLKKMVGAHVKYRALFKNFPDDIPNDEEYFFKRVVGYVTNAFDVVPDDILPLSCGHVINTRLFNVDDFGACPICQMQVDELDDDESDRPELEDITPLKMIRLVSENDIKQIFANLLSAKSSISEDNRGVINEMIRDDPSLFAAVPANIHMKENLAVIAGLAVKYKYNGIGEDYSTDASNVLLNNIKTATDVLRLAVQLNGGDVSLAENTRIKLKNNERRVIMYLLNDIKNPEEDMLRYKMRWIRLAEVIHIGKFAKKYPNAFKACDMLRNHASDIKTFNSKIEKYVESINGGDRADEGNLLELIVTRPGELARRLDWMLRTFTAQSAVILAFKEVIDKLPTPMLLTLNNHFKFRHENLDDRYFMPKGVVAKIQVIKDARDTIDIPVTMKITKMINNNLLLRFSKLEDLGDVYIDEKLKGYLVPLVQRNASKSLVTVARGSQIPLMETVAARMFLYWKESESRVDVDLSALSYDADWNYKGHISYTNLTGIGGIHSGDIQSAPNGAAEFIDINLATALGNGVRYVVMSVISYTGQPFITFECFAGIMERNKVDSGKKFEPTTVVNKFDVAADTKYAIPLIFDLVENKIIWADIALTSNAGANVESKSGNVVKMSKAIMAMATEKPNMFDLLWLHAEARGDLVDYEREDGKKYDTEFGVDMAYKVDEILADWL